MVTLFSAIFQIKAFPPVFSYSYLDTSVKELWFIVISQNEKLTSIYNLIHKSFYEFYISNEFSF